MVKRFWCLENPAGSSGSMPLKWKNTRGSPFDRHTPAPSCVTVRWAMFQ